MTIYLTSDQHYGHRNIIKYCNRPFSDEHEMDEELITRHNKIVKHGDTVYVLGDFTMKDPSNYLRRLNGNIILIPGNHDDLSKWTHNSSGKIVHIAPPVLEVSVNGQLFVLAHYAMVVWNQSHYNSIQLYGHSHSTLPPSVNQLDVGVDNAYKIFGEYRPFSVNEIMQLVKTYPKRTVDDHHDTKR